MAETCPKCGKEATSMPDYGAQGPECIGMECRSCGWSLSYAALQAVVDKLREAHNKAASAADVLRTSFGAHGSHWDRTMQHGAGCPQCKKESAARREAEILLREAAEAAKETT